MHIKSVVVEGFKTYRDQTSVDLTPNLNCIVGANGSGKSNLFHAIRFVLSDVFGTLRAEERQRLLHEGAGHAVMSAYVEIVFCNKDRRMPVERDEVRLRRNIGLKKDEYYLDKKHASKTEIVNLLESAGFSRTNPYYCVQQGRITKMATMSDKERLELLKEIGGTSVYEEKREESMKIMKETKTREDAVKETVAFIESRLEELDEEKEELEKYVKLDKAKRSIEYAIYDKELSEARQKLDDVEERRRHASERARMTEEETIGAKLEVKELEKATKNAEREIERLSREATGIDVERKEISERRATKELDVQDLQESIERFTLQKADAEDQKMSVEERAKEIRDKLSKAKPKFEKAKEDEDAKQSEVLQCERKLNALHAKRGRSAQFQTEKQRDEWIDEQVKNTEATIALKKKEIERSENDIKDIEQEQEKDTKELERLEKQLQSASKELQKLDEEHEKILAKRNKVQNERKTLQRKDADFDSELAKLGEDVQKYEKQLEYSMARDLHRGLAAVQRIVRERGITGVHGPLIELMECDSRFNSAVEAAAGNQLFQIVVDNDDIGSEIIKHLNKEKAGRVTFLPLNRLQMQNVKYPEDKNAFPLLNKITRDEKYNVAFSQVFSRVLICRNIDVAADMSKTTNLNCVTMDGDTVSSKGVMSGGHRDANKSRLQAVKAVKTCVERRDALKEEASKVKTELSALEQTVSVAVGEVQKVESNRRHVAQTVDRLKTELRHFSDTATRSEQLTRQNADAIKALRDEIELAELDAKDLAKEKGTKLDVQLTAEEKKEFEELNPKLVSMKEELSNLSAARVELQATCESLEETLKSNLERSLRRLANQTTEVDVEAKTREFQKLSAQLKALRAEETEINEKHKKAMKALADAKSDADSQKVRLENLRAKVEDVRGNLGTEEREMEALTSKRANYAAKVDAIQRKIRDVGSLPADAFEKYNSYTPEQLRKELGKTNEGLGQLSHVNKKAIDQWEQFTEQRDELRERRTEIAEASKKILELMEHLDRKKDEAIERTFKQASLNFKEVFSQLVPGGKGELVMQRKKTVVPEVGGKDANDGGKSSDAPAAAAVNAAAGFMDKYSGVKIKLHFGGGGETMQMKQLSGGQKTVVAVALIFAIQRCDPMPFYLFDEIDAALDPQYRTSVASMIREQADKGTQFVCTTFRPEIVRKANQLIGVSHVNKVSITQKVDVNEALRFVGDTTEGVPESVLTPVTKKTRDAAANKMKRARQEIEAEG
jgi:structural maintenance of chromosome 3 (chondroitin sulfate proteoglycan 6)